MTRTILISGATAGIGQAAARRFAAGGWRVIGTGRRGERLRALQEELGETFLPLGARRVRLSTPGNARRLHRPRLFRLWAVVRY